MTEPRHDTYRDARQERIGLFVLFVLCVLSRLLTSINYVEDIDSLRFALAVIDYDVTELRPHFPGYPFFCFVAWLLHEVIGSRAATFALIGGLSTFVLIESALAIARLRVTSLAGAILALLLFFNPLIWLLGNRTMPDLMGAACLFAAYRLLLGSRSSRGRAWGMLLAGLLPGIRLSYLPFAIIPIIVALARDGRRTRLAGTLLLGLALWLVPFVAITGWNDLVRAARTQTAGHFTDFGGTIETEPSLARRVMRTAEGIVADGLGTYWPGRSPVTIVVAAGFAIVFIAAAVRLRRDRSVTPDGWIAAGSWLLYALWIFLFQNVVHNSRHVLPLLPFLLTAAALGAAYLLRSRDRLRIVPAVAVGLFLLAYAYTGGYLAWQHRRPTALAQVRTHLASIGSDKVCVVSVPLVNYYLAAQGVRARFISVEESVADSLAASPCERVITIGDYRALVPGQPRETRRFFHNPYVNRVWPVLDVYDYGE